MDDLRFIELREVEFEDGLSSNPAIKIQEVSCVPNAPNTMINCIGALVRRRDDKIRVIWVAKRSNINLNY